MSEHSLPVRSVAGTRRLPFVMYFVPMHFRRTAHYDGNGVCLLH
jgi:hypothetical protein